MGNNITQTLEQIIAKLSEEDLKAAIIGLRDFDENDTPAQGVFRRIMVECIEVTQRDEAAVMGFGRYALLRAAAYKWATSA